MPSQTMRPDLDGDLAVLLLRTDRNPVHHGTLGAIRSLGRAGVRVHAMLEGRAVPAARSRHLHRRHAWGPPPTGGPGALIRHLELIAGRIGGRPLLLPVDDAGAIFAAENAGALGRSFTLAGQDPSAPRRVADKATLLAQCVRYGIDCPETHVPASAAEVDAAVERLGLPLMAKWARPWLLPSGMRGTAPVASAAEAHALYGLAAGVDAGPLLLQRHIPLDGGDWFFQGYFDEDYGCVFGATGRKHLAHPPGAGHTVHGEWVLDPELDQLARKIVNVLGCRGVVDLDFRRDARTGVHHLLDFNPRLGAQFRLFRDRQGLDLVRALHLERSGRAVPPVRPAYGRVLQVENHLLRHALARPVRPAALLAGLRDADELAWFAADDPLPFLAMGRHTLARAGRAAAARAIRATRRAPIQTRTDDRTDK